MARISPVVRRLLVSASGLSCKRTEKHSGRLSGEGLLDERVVRKELCRADDRLFLKAKDLAVLRGEAIHHLGLLLFHVDDLFSLRVFVGRCPGD